MSAPHFFKPAWGNVVLASLNTFLAIKPFLFDRFIQVNVCHVFFQICTLQKTRTQIMLWVHFLPSAKPVDQSYKSWLTFESNQMHLPSNTYVFKLVVLLLLKARFFHKMSWLWTDIKYPIFVSVCHLPFCFCNHGNMTIKWCWVPCGCPGIVADCWTFMKRGKHVCWVWIHVWEKQH